MREHKIELSVRQTIRVIYKSFRRYVYSRDNNKEAFLTEGCSISYELRTIIRKPHSSWNYDNVSEWNVSLFSADSLGSNKFPWKQ